MNPDKKCSNCIFQCLKTDNSQEFHLCLQSLNKCAFSRTYGKCGKNGLYYREMYNTEISEVKKLLRH